METDIFSTLLEGKPITLDNLQKIWEAVLEPFCESDDETFAQITPIKYLARYLLRKVNHHPECQQQNVLISLVDAIRFYTNKDPYLPGQEKQAIMIGQMYEWLESHANQLPGITVGTYLAYLREEEVIETGSIDFTMTIREFLLEHTDITTVPHRLANSLVRNGILTLLHLLLLVKTTPNWQTKMLSMPGLGEGMLQMIEAILDKLGGYSIDASELYRTIPDMISELNLSSVYNVSIEVGDKRLGTVLERLGITPDNDRILHLTLREISKAKPHFSALILDRQPNHTLHILLAIMRIQEREV